MPPQRAAVSMVPLMGSTRPLTAAVVSSTAFLSEPVADAYSVCPLRLIKLCEA